jgi:putative ABC transport system substrate-binding protein
MKKKIIIGVVAALIVAAIVVASVLPGGSNTNDDGVFHIGVCQLDVHPALDAATEGFIAALKAELGEDKVKIDLQNAAGEATNCTNIVNAFVSKNYDLIMANATPALQAATAATATIPVLGTSVTEYGVALGIDNFTGVTGMNVSGTSDLAPLDKQAQMILDLVPGVQTVGIIYCSGEPNSQYQVNVVKEYLEGKNITVKLYSFADSNDLPAITQTAVNEVNAIYIPTDNTVARSTGIIDNICRPAKMPVICGEENSAKGCGIVALSISYYDLGYTTGQMAAKILRGEAKVGEMAIQYATPVYKYNEEICRELNITVPENYEAIQ